MDLEQISIGKMAELNHVSEQTLRLYDRIGLLKPEITNKKTGYRYYTIGQSATLDMIQYYKHMGFSLKQIQEELENIDSMQHVLRKRYNEIEAEIKQLELCKKSIQRSLDNYSRYLTLPRVGEIFIEYTPPRKIIVYNTGYNILNHDYKHYEYNLRLLKNYLLDINFPMIYFCNAGTIIRKKHIETSRLYSDEIYLLTDESSSYDTIEEVPSGSYLSMCCSGFSKEKEYAAVLLAEIKKRKYKIDGDYFCEVISEFPNDSEKQRQFFYKIQVKIL